MLRWSIGIIYAAKVPTEGGLYLPDLTLLHEKKQKALPFRARMNAIAFLLAAFFVS